MNRSEYLRYLMKMHNIKKDKVIELLSYYNFNLQPYYISSWIKDKGVRKISIPALRILQLSCHIKKLTGKWPEPDNRGMPGKARTD